MKIRKLDQSYTLIDIYVDEFNDSAITGLMRRYSCLASARMSTSKFGLETRNTLKFYVHHIFFNKQDRKTVIEEIRSTFADKEISMKVLG